MSWLSFLSGLLRFAGSLARWLESRQLLQAGERAAIATGLEKVLADVEAVRKSRDRLVDPGERQRLRDKFTRADDK